MPAPAAVAKRLIDVGTWDFSAARRGADGQPECVERWTFRRDGSGVILSGQLRLDLRWKVIRDAGVGTFVYTADVARSGGADCLGKTNPLNPDGAGRRGFQLLFYDDGEGALVCFEGDIRRRRDGTAYRALDPALCWGQIIPAQSPPPPLH